MKRVVRYGLIIVLLAAASFAALYFVFPETLFTLATAAQRRGAGLTAKQVQVDDHVIPYLEGGAGETVILLHGFADRKDTWTPLAWYVRGYHLVIPDVPGFGESSQVAADDYGIESQVARIHRFVEVLHLDRFHLAGNSMGGALAATYAARHPDKVSTLTLEDPAGAPSPHKSAFLTELEKGTNLLSPRNAGEFDRLVTMLFVKAPPVPEQFRKVLRDDLAAHREFNGKIWRDWQPERFSLEPVLALIQAPVLIVWGAQDQILDVGGVAFLEQRLKNHQTVIVSETGHTPHAEKPEAVGAAFVRFLKQRR